MEGMEYPEFREKIAEKCENTMNWINTYNSGTPSFQNNIADKLRRFQKTDNCSKDYATIVEDATTGKREDGKMFICDLDMQIFDLIINGLFFSRVIH